MPSEIYLAAESGRPKEILDAWREDMKQAQRCMAACMERIGANGAFRFDVFDKPTAFRFPRNEAPEGWTKPSAKGASRPKKTNREAIAELDGLAWFESLDSLVPRELGLPTAVKADDMQYSCLPKPRSKGSGCNLIRPRKVPTRRCPETAG